MLWKYDYVPSGAFDFEMDGNTTVSDSNVAKVKNAISKITFNANSANNFYGISKTVQPSSIRHMTLIRT